MPEGQAEEKEDGIPVQEGLAVTSGPGVCQSTALRTLTPVPLLWPGLTWDRRDRGRTYIACLPGKLSGLSGRGSEDRGYLRQWGSRAPDTRKRIRVEPVGSESDLQGHPWCGDRRTLCVHCACCPGSLRQDRGQGLSPAHPDSKKAAPELNITELPPHRVHMPRQDKKSLLAVPAGVGVGVWGRVSHARWAKLLMAGTTKGEGHREGNGHVWSSRRKCIGCLGTGRAAQDRVREGDLDIPDVRACLFTGAHRWSAHMRTHRRRPCCLGYSCSHRP